MIKRNTFQIYSYSILDANISWNTPYVFEKKQAILCHKTPQIKTPYDNKQVKLKWTMTKYTSDRSSQSQSKSKTEGIRQLREKIWKIVTWSEQYPETSVFSSGFGEYNPKNALKKQTFELKEL